MLLPKEQVLIIQPMSAMPCPGNNNYNNMDYHTTATIGSSVFDDGTWIGGSGDTDASRVPALTSSNGASWCLGALVP